MTPEERAEQFMKKEWGHSFDKELNYYLTNAHLAGQQSALEPQPMETAPKDVEILIKEPEYGYRIAKWFEYSTTGEGFFSANAMRINNPQCWWPLPQPPVKQ